MTVLQMLYVLRARWLAGACTFFAVVGIGILSAFMLPKQYTAKASVLLDVKSTDPIAGASMQALAISHYMATQADVISSERVISGALRSLAMDKDPAMLSQWEKETDGHGEFAAWFAEQVLRNFQVLPARESNVITVAYTSPSRTQSAAVANAVVDSYIATTIDLRTDPAKQYNDFFDARAKELRQALEQAQARLSDYQREIGVVVSDEKLDIENNRLAELSSQLVTAQGAAAEANSRHTISASHADSMPDVQSNPILAGLRVKLAEKELERQTLSTKYGERHPTMTTLIADIGQIRTQIDAETGKVVRGIALSSSAVQGKVAQLQAALEAHRARVLRLKSQRDLAAVLGRDVENAERAYSAAFVRNTQSNLESRATQTNVSILQRASPPAKPSSPRVVRNLVLSILLGGLLGAATALGREWRDRRLRIDADVALLLGQPLLGVLPKQAGVGKRGRRVDRSPAARPDGAAASPEFALRTLPDPR